MSLKLLPLTAAIALVLSGCNSDNSTFDGKDNIETPIDQSVLQYVDPLIGTADAGHTFPGAVVPSGMVQLSPDTQLTGWHSSSGYHDPSDYTKGTIIDKDLPLYGFSHTHLSGTGIGGLGDISFLPFSLDNQSEKASFAKVNEVAQAGFYQVTLDESDIKVELTASERVGFHRYTFAPDQPQQLKVDLNTTLNTDWGSKSMRNKIIIIDDYTIIGERDSHGFGGWSMNQRVYFYAKFDRKIKSIQLTVEGEPVKGNSAESISRIVPMMQVKNAVSKPMSLPLLSLNQAMNLLLQKLPFLRLALKALRKTISKKQISLLIKLNSKLSRSGLNH